VIRTLHGDAVLVRLRHLGRRIWATSTANGLTRVAVGGAHGGGAYFKGAVRVYSGATGAEVYTIYGRPA
jgi:hypothetical protein